MSTTQLKITGMMCEACVSHVKKALQELGGVNEVTVDLPAERAIIQHEGAPTEAMIEAVVEAGYDAQAA